MPLFRFETSIVASPLEFNFICFTNWPNEEYISANEFGSPMAEIVNLSVAGLGKMMILETFLISLPDKARFNETASQFSGK